MFLKIPKYPNIFQKSLFFSHNYFFNETLALAEKKTANTFCTLHLAPLLAPPCLKLTSLGMMGTLDMGNTAAQLDCSLAVTNSPSTVNNGKNFHFIRILNKKAKKIEQFLFQII